MENLIESRKKLKEYLGEIGLGIGSVVSRRYIVVAKDGYSFSEEDSLLVVVDINFSEFLVDGKLDCINFAMAGNLDKKTYSEFGFHESLNPQGDPEMKVVTKVSKASVHKLFDDAYGADLMKLG